MSYGLRVWRSDGSLVLNINDRMVHLHSLHTIPANQHAYNTEWWFSVPGMRSTWSVVNADSIWANYFTITIVNDGFYVRNRWGGVSHFPYTRVFAAWRG